MLTIADALQMSAVSIVGASIGSNLALVGCGNDPDCVTAVALSPSANYFGVQPIGAITGGLSARPVLLIASYDDPNPSVDSIQQFMAVASGEVRARFYTGRAHGTALFNNRLDSVTALIVNWLGEHTPSA